MQIIVNYLSLEPAASPDDNDIDLLTYIQDGKSFIYTYKLQTVSVKKIM